MVRTERVEHRAVAARDGREGGLVHGREVVVLRERVDRELPVDRRSPAPSRPAATTARCPRSPVRRQGVPGSAGMSSVASGSSDDPQEACAFGRRQFGQSRCCPSIFRETPPCPARRPGCRRGRSSTRGTDKRADARHRILRRSATAGAGRRCRTPSPTRRHVRVSRIDRPITVFVQYEPGFGSSET